MNIRKKYIRVTQLFFLLTIGVLGRANAGSTTINGILTVFGSVDFFATTSLLGVTVVTSTMHAAGPAIFTNSSKFFGPVTLNGASTINGTTILAGSTTLTNTTHIAGPVSMSNTVTQNGATTFNGATTHNGSDTFNSSATFTGSETHNGAATFNGTTTLLGSTTLTNTTHIAGPVTFTGSETHNGAATFNGTTTLLGSTTLTNTTHIAGPVTFTGTEIHNGAATFNALFGNLNGNANTATTATNFSGSLAGDVVGPQGSTSVRFVGGVSELQIFDIYEAVLLEATSTNVAGVLVERDDVGSFQANHIILNGLDALSTSTILVAGGNLALAPNLTFFVDNIAGESGTLVNNIGVTNLTVVNTMAPSDQRLKNDITDLDNELCLALVNQLVPHEFNYVPEVKKAMNDDGNRHVGFIAQELAKVDPRFVSIPAGKRTLGDLTLEELAFVKQELFVPLLVGALKAEDKKVASKAERAEIEVLQARLEALEALIASMKNK